ncbi:MAG: hypothetical protein KZQ99_06520 [Candidatus Thiodiazotropha sp. (ex Dulcina madagascariensis)]|nr:hypothetical protein [Candidatus Thiodiazotropha sp. (ex Dulcina madagascariensis)]MCU7928275.1 hypothetical protein [Candidatus Thiodiazotropha sp. (ex Dulcina madagascariensis)]MCU7934520.1 hypothetical protein [Candidatus Thiodiazotropha sp. (ex Dulcina madagascariensis)]
MDRKVIDEMSEEAWEKLATQYKVTLEELKEKAIQHAVERSAAIADKAAPTANENNCIDFDEEIPLPPPIGVAVSLQVSGKVCMDTDSDKWQGNGKVCVNPIIGDPTCGSLEINNEKIEGEVTLNPGGAIGSMQMKVGFNPQSQCVYTRGELKGPLDVHLASLDRDNLVCF